MIAIGYNGISSPSAPVQTGNMSAQESAQASELSGTSNTGWPYFDTFAEPFWSLSLASSVSLAGREASVPEAISAKKSPPNNSYEDPEVSEAHGGKSDSWKRTIASDKSFLAADRENEKKRIRDKDEVKKSGKSSAKKPQRRVTRKDRDREFDPLREIQRARETITRVIRDIL
jgi:hypothetical protein